MQYQEFKPDWPLNLFVECFWTLEAEHAAGSSPERVLPDGCAEIILNFGDRFQQHKTGNIELQPRFFLVGQITGPLSISPTGIVKLIGIRFHPGGTRPFLKLPMHQITNRYVNLADIPEYFPPGWINPLEDAPSLSAAIRKLESVLLSKIQRTNADLSSLALARRIIHERGLASVNAIANDAGISARQLERKFLRDVGVGPKVLGRILRFQQVFRAISQENPSWARVALECGYYDQAHLIRDFREFSATTPSVLFFHSQYID